ncbi:MAG: hypothetical protein KDC66_13830 [Phaeodactylibacter sp.]|nr:hypothetical protein [Phaeodactylibacter sp.]MCB9274777.1 class I SAM-dependent methyltransferase [Lewinellaceae bacterium]
MDRLKDNIDKQIEFNKGKNLFAGGAGRALRFIQETAAIIEDPGGISESEVSLLVDYATEKALQEFCRVNQYFAFDAPAQQELRKIYAALFTKIRAHKYDAESLSEAHYQNLKQWLKAANPFSEKVYSDKGPELEPVACAEYSPELQLGILRVSAAPFMEPILDIGCGKEGSLVAHLRSQGIEAYGLDRFAAEAPYLTKGDWLEFNFGKNKWGTLISNLGFSNHFNHHHFREDGNYIAYAKKYMDILHSLKTGGCFYYAPGLPFIEQYLDEQEYLVVGREIEGYDFKAAAVKRLK